MALSEKINVFLIGIEKKEQLLLKGIFQLSQSREREYTIAERNRSEFENFIYSDIIIVDKDSIKSIQQWKQLAIQAGNDFSITTVFLTNKKPETNSYTEIQKPLIALRVLNALDLLSITPKESISETAIKSVTNSDFENPTDTTSFTVSDDQNILVIDDSLPVRKHLEHELNKFNCHVDFSETAEDGLNNILNNKYDLVFLDVVLPGMDGYELCKKIKRNKALRDIPIVMLTSKSSPFDKVRGSLAGCDNYLTKPVDANKFNQIVEEHLQTEQALQA